MPDLRDKQKKALLSLLHLNQVVETGPKATTWKILVYDSECSAIINPQFSVQELRDAGVTLHMRAESPRQAIRDVPAVYLLRPGDKSLSILKQDISANLYSAYYINFSSPLPRILLESLARSYINNLTAIQMQVMDHSVQFVMLEEDLFTLDMKDSFTKLNLAKSVTQANEELVRCEDGLFSVFTTLGGYPDISCLSGNVAEQLSRRLVNRFKETVLSSNSRGNFKQMDIGHEAGNNRPYLIILDRNVDVAEILRHPSTYQALLDELFEPSLNRLCIQNNVGEVEFTVNLDKRTDEFWEMQSNKGFPRVVEAAEKERQRLLSKEIELKKKTQELSSNSGTSFKNAVVDLERFEEEKRLINLHYKILESCMEEISKRGVPTFFEIEEQVMASSTSVHISKINEILDTNIGTDMDRLRLLCIWLLSQSLSIEEVNKAKAYAKTHFKKSKLVTSNAVEKLFDVVQTLCASSNNTLRVTQNIANLQNNSGVSQAAAWASNFLKEGSKLLEKLIPNVHEANIMSKLCARIIKNRNTGNSIEGHSGEILHFDMVSGHTNTYPHKEKIIEKTVIVFIVGGSNISEYQNLQEYFNSRFPKVELIVGTTDMVNGDTFLSQLLHRRGADNTA
jgi:hypothetical protein